MAAIRMAAAATVSRAPHRVRTFMETSFRMDCGHLTACRLTLAIRRGAPSKTYACHLSRIGVDILGITGIERPLSVFACISHAWPFDSLDQTRAQDKPAGLRRTS